MAETPRRLSPQGSEPEPTVVGPDDVGLSPEESRREFLSSATAIGMGCALAAGYGTFAVMGLNYLYPSQPHSSTWQFLATIDQLPLGASMVFQTPTGAKVVVTRQGEADAVESFVALSSVCPHLGCQVHWEPQNDRFFCPCHNGVFNRQGSPLEGPPAKANPPQPLARFPLKLEENLLFIEVPLESVGRKSLASCPASEKQEAMHVCRHGAGPESAAPEETT